LRQERRISADKLLPLGKNRLPVFVERELDALVPDRLGLFGLARTLSSPGSQLAAIPLPLVFLPYFEGVEGSGSVRSAALAESRWKFRDTLFLSFHIHVGAPANK
jgi:hypothetical protein